jgi:flavin reductase (DIM6/NTAB) family NADH-FMN oxidoreductase RutF
MAKKNVGKSFNIFPMPVVIVGTVTDGKPNFMTAAWITKLNSDPPLLGVSLGRRQHTAKGIEQSQQFSVSFPSVDQMTLTDYLGLVHGYEEDKAAHVDIFRGALESAPMVRQCPLTLECRLAQKVDLPKDFFFIGEVANVYASEAVLTNGKVDPVKLRPFVLTMPGNTYWALGQPVGEAWSIGKTMLQPAEGSDSR